MRDYFYAGGEGPVPLEVLQNQKYRDVVSIRLYYDWHTYVLLLNLLEEELTLPQGCFDGRMRADDAAKPQLCTDDKETC